MTIWSWIGTRVLKRIEANPTFQEHLARAERSEPFEKAAGELSRSRMSDDEALGELRSRVPDNEVGLANAVRLASVRRTDYLNDREYRLLSALADGMPVRDMDPALADLFEAERELGWLPLTEACERLVALEPRLGDVMNRAQAPGFRRRDGESARDTAKRARPLREDVSALLGYSGQRYPLLRSDISASIFLQYIWVMTNGRRRDLLSTPYFAERHVRQSSSGSLDLRPSATN
jgi:hypothetical protein